LLYVAQLRDIGLIVPLTSIVLLCFMKNTNHWCLWVLGIDTSTSSTTHSMKPNVDEEEDKKVPPIHSRVQIPSTQVLDQVDYIVQPQIQVQDNHTQPLQRR
jgi:hypothetical protein